MKMINSNRRGVAIIVALFFSFCMLILFVAMMYRQSSTASHNKLTIQERQAFFAARAAMQHFILKARLFPTELYDAVEFAQGKNPLCNFAEFEATDSSGRNAFEPFSGKPDLYVKVLPERENDAKGQPKYFYHLLPGKDAFIRIGSYHNPDYRFLYPDSADTDDKERYLKPKKPSADWKADKFLKYYIRDCTNSVVNGSKLQVPLEMVISKDIKNINQWDAATMDGYPYTLNYHVTDVKIQSIKGLRKYGEEAIEINVDGSAKDFQGKTTAQTQKRVQRITRRGSID